MFALMPALLAIPLLAPAPAMAAPTARQNGLQVINSCYNNGQVALTYDDGVYRYEQGVADALASVGGKGTFFLNGNNYDCIYNHVDTVRALHQQYVQFLQNNPQYVPLSLSIPLMPRLTVRQHTLGSHTWSHKDMTTLSDAEMHDELARVEEAFIRILGLKPLWFRPPYGSYNDRVLNVLAQRGYKYVALWSADTGDSLGESPDHQKGVMNDVANTYPQPAIILQHSVLQDSVDTTWYGVNQLRNRGYNLVAADVCTNTEWPYVYVGEPQQQDGSWTC